MTKEKLEQEEDISVVSDNISIELPNPQTEEATLSWRNNPSYNFSDWKLRVVTLQNQDGEKANNASIHTETIYCVHRNILAIGERRSAYFANLLHYNIDDGDSSSRIELHFRAAEHFPDLLDYMYSSRAFVITTTNAIPLLFLSQIFQVLALAQLVENFIEKDIGLLNAGCYIADALRFRDEEILRRVIKTCEKEALSLFGFGSINSRISQNEIMDVPSLLSSLARGEEACKTILSFVSTKRIPFRIPSCTNAENIV